MKRHYIKTSYCALNYNIDCYCWFSLSFAYVSNIDKEQAKYSFNVLFNQIYAYSDTFNNKWELNRYLKDSKRHIKHFSKKETKRVIRNYGKKEWI